MPENKAPAQDASSRCCMIRRQQHVGIMYVWCREGGFACWRGADNVPDGGLLLQVAFVRCGITELIILGVWFEGEREREKERVFPIGSSLHDMSQDSKRLLDVVGIDGVVHAGFVLMQVYLLSVRPTRLPYHCYNLTSGGNDHICWWPTRFRLCLRCTEYSWVGILRVHV